MSVTLSATRYRRLDRLTKLLGVAFVAIGLETGGQTAVGIAFGALGVALAVLTVFIECEQ
ncbi:hypothetical protein SAMN04487948_11228 [Halogranum amylolyticum]|uniref:DUF8120 domain-containing protein n=1 Tax=Halogranum amylolyticum TaxID=660520 RepID=A0A1H8UQE3_9EURY|nr:hypothetical protein [Halogranum amylolyticum]SEP05336.1 hypothetical protein SAMN04487948_11228 [Halogranum amylolyticum]